MSTARYIVSKRKIPRNRKVSGVFLLCEKKVIYEFSMWKLEKNLSVRENTEKFKIEKSDQRCQNGAKKKLLRIFAIHRSNFLPAFDLFNLFSMFRIMMILQLQTDFFHNFRSGFIIKLIEWILNGNRKVLMRNIWMSITSRKKNGKSKYRNWSRRKSI